MNTTNVHTYARSKKRACRHDVKLTFKWPFQNDMGLKPHDCAKVMGQKECAEFLLLYETSLEISWPFLEKFCRVTGTQHIPLDT